MPFYLSDFYGGLGNQLFSIITLYALAKKYNTTFSVNTDTLNATGFLSYYKIYFNEFTCLLQCPYYSVRDNTFPVIRYTVEQFKDYEFDVNITSTHIIYICGLPMKYSLFYSYLDDIKSLFHSYKKSTYPTISLNNPSLCIAIRRFTDEKSEHWATSLEYYKKAIKHMSTKYNSCIIHIYTDTSDSSKVIMPFIQEYFGNSCINIEEFCGNKELQTDIEHLFTMFDYDNYILCNSTYHYWAALLTTNQNATVLYPSDCEWYPHIACNNWIRL